MSNLTHRQSIIQEKRKTTPWRKFVMEICSRMPFMFYKNTGWTSTYPPVGKFSIASLKDSEDIAIQEADFQGSLFDDMTKLFSKSTLSNINHRGVNENSEYSDTAVNVKNAYLSFVVTKNAENVLYSFMTRESADVVNSMYAVDGSSVVYFSKGIINSSKVFYSKYIIGSHDIWFSSNLNSCSECIFCDNLTNQSYCIYNKEYPKDEYYEKKNQILDEKYKFHSYYEQLTDVGVNFGSQNCEGNFVINSDGIRNGYIVYNGKNGHNVSVIGSVDEGGEWYDYFVGGAGCTNVYAAVNSGNFSQYLYCSWGLGRCHTCFYCYKLEACSFCLSCIGLKNKSYCILNKQYTKEERYTKVDEIFGQMHADGTLGEFFPASMNPFYFNDTAAYLIDPSFTKEEVTAAGYLRRDEPIKVDIPEGALVIKTSELGRFESRSVGTHSNASEQERHIDPEILKYIIQDEQGNVYRIMKMEYDFLMKYGLPLPRKHWLDRMKENFRIG